jgi:hypothetical protein
VVGLLSAMAMGGLYWWWMKRRQRNRLQP